ncbi:MAG: hypothetical protein EBV07_01600 [Proteobacteria bacterium]|nr:hypothetical protein [Pseudomonadota bacterium]
MQRVDVLGHVHERLIGRHALRLGDRPGDVLGQAARDAQQASRRRCEADARGEHVLDRRRADLPGQAVGAGDRVAVDHAAPGLPGVLGGRKRQVELGVVGRAGRVDHERDEAHVAAVPATRKAGDGAWGAGSGRLVRVGGVAVAERVVGVPVARQRRPCDGRDLEGLAAHVDQVAD